MAIWPSAVATDADLYVAKNALQTTLATALGTGDTTIVLASATGFPVAGAVVIGNEVIFYTNISGASLTGCTRGADGTTAATHSVGVPVGAAVIAFHHNGLKDEIIAIETYLNTKFGTSGSAYGTAKALQTNATTGIPEVSSVSNTELGYLSGVTSAIQTQLGLKAPLASPTFTGTVTVPTPFTVGAVSVTATGTEMNYLVGVSSAIQTQLGLKAPLASPTFTGTVTTAGIAMGSNKITGLANGTATTDATAFGQLHLLQAPVSASETTGGTTTSSSFVNKGVSATITPTRSTSKIFGIITVPCALQAAGKNMTLGVSGTTNSDLYTTTTSPARYRQPTGDTSQQGNTVTFWFIDTPGNVLAQTYQLRVCSNDGATVAAVGNSVFTGAQTSMILFEVA